MSEVSNVVKHSYHCRAANVSERSEPNNRVLFEILLGIYIYKYIHICIYIYIYIYIYVRTLHKQVLQLQKLDGCTLHRMAYSSAAV